MNPRLCLGSGGLLSVACQHPESCVHSSWWEGAGGCAGWCHAAFWPRAICQYLPEVAGGSAEIGVGWDWGTVSHQVMPAVSLASFGMWDGYLEEGNRPQHFLFVTLF